MRIINSTHILTIISFIITFSLSSVSAFSSSNTLAGIDVTTFPVDNQLYARNIYTNKASVEVSGKVYSWSGYNQVKLIIKRNGSNYNSILRNLSFSGGTDNFSINVDIPAELANFDFELYGVNGNTETLERSVTKVVAGDVYIINGQSNAQARAAAHPSDLGPFLRSYNSAWGWNLVNFSYPGQWGARIGRNIIDNENIPVAIFNEAEGAQQINFFLKNSIYTGNYGKLYSRLEAAGVREDVRAAFWFQGEADGWQTSTTDYKNALKDLHYDWASDYNTEQTYVFQLRFQSCTHPEPDVLEAQRQAAKEVSKIQILSTSNAAHDGCHFDYYGGYQTLADRMYDLMAKDLYGGSSSNVQSPDISSAALSGSTIEIEMTNTYSLTTTGYPWSDFSLEGNTNAYISGGYVSGNKIYVELSGSTSGIDGITYLAHPGGANSWITNSNGVGILSFYDVDVSGTTSGGGTGGGGGGSTTCSVSTGDCSIAITGLDNSDDTKIFDSNWSIVWRCNPWQGGGCSNSETIEDLSNGTYWVQSCGETKSYTVSCGGGGTGGGGGSTGGDECSVSTGDCSISINGLDNDDDAKVFDENWSIVWRCNPWQNGGCSNSETIENLSNGTYRVQACGETKSYTISCGGSTGGGTGGGGGSSDGTDLELTLSADKSDFIIYENIAFTITVKNDGDEDASNVEVSFPKPNNIAYSSHNTSQGTYNLWDGLWEIGNIPAGQTKVLEINLFTLTGNGTIKFFAQVDEADQDDVDSTPGNDFNQTANEDDEALVVLEHAAGSRSESENKVVNLGQNRFLAIQKLFPQPASDEIKLQLSANTESNPKLRIYNVLSQSVQQKTINVEEGYNEIQFDISELPSGMYYILFETANRHTPIHFVKQRL